MSHWDPASQRNVHPQISVITVCKNAEETIATTLKSVFSQTLLPLEHLIIDGASTDSTLTITKQNQWFGLKIHSEPDSGIADAMNKGIKLSHGEWLLFLNADDHLTHANTLNEIVPMLDSEADVVGFPVLFGGTIYQSKLKCPRGANWYLNFKTGLLHQGSLIRRELFESIGYFDTDFRVTMDYEFFLRAYKQGARFSTHNMPPLAVMGDSGISSRNDWLSLSQRFNEERLSQRKNSTGVFRMLQKIYWMLYPKYRYLRMVLHQWTGRTQ